MNLLICKLKPKSPLHLGERESFREGTEVFVHSDTLFSTFCHGYLLLYGREKLEELLKKFLDRNLTFVISSAFPFWNDKLYFPIPENQIPKNKELKKKLFIEKSGFEKLLSGKRVEEIENIIEFIPNKNNKRPYVTTDVPRVGLSRLTNHPGENFFHFGEVIYKENAGLFFLYDLKDKSIEKQFHTTFRLLADEGIGGDRTLGKGLFNEPEFSNVDINVPSNNSGIVTLSLFLPTQDELNDIGESYYQLISRRGYIYSPQCQSLRRKSVRMFKEGAVFTTNKKGRIVDVTPEIFKEHRIYRYGLAFTLPCVLEVKNED